MPKMSPGNFLLLNMGQTPLVRLRIMNPSASVAYPTFLPISAQVSTSETPKWRCHVGAPLICHVFRPTFWTFSCFNLCLHILQAMISSCFYVIFTQNKHIFYCKLGSVYQQLIETSLPK